MIRKIRTIENDSYYRTDFDWMVLTIILSSSTFHTIYILLDIYQLFFSSMPKWSWFEGREIEWRKEFNGHSLCQQRFAFVGCRGKQSSPIKVSMSSESCASFFALALWCGLCYYYYQPEDCVSQFSYYHHMVGVYVPTYYTIVLRDSHIAGKKF